MLDVLLYRTLVRDVNQAADDSFSLNLGAIHC